jgi:hypothetical protein
MSNHSRRAALTAALATAMAVLSGACGSGTTTDAELLVKSSSTTRTVVNNGATITLTVTATDGFGKSGTGKVTAKSDIGTLSDDAMTLDGNGQAVFTFTCDAATDATCVTMGSVSAHFTFDWTPAKPDGAAKVESTFAITVQNYVPFDAGVDAGLPGPHGPFDGGYNGDYEIQSVSTTKDVLIATTTDSATVVFELLQNIVGTPPLEGKMLHIAINTGSLSATSAAPVRETDLPTGSDGKVTVQVFTESVTTAGPLNIVASIRDPSNNLVFNTRTLSVVSVYKIVNLASPNTFPVITVAYSGAKHQYTDVFFQVQDGAGAPVSGVNVAFSTDNGVAGCTLLPLTAFSDDHGTVKTRLTAGPSKGTVYVTASLADVTEQPDGGATLIHTSVSTRIVLGQPSDDNIGVDCDRKTLGAYQSQAIRTATCSITYADQSGETPPFADDINPDWLVEAGTFHKNPATVTSATMAFSTNAKLPADQAPLSSEPFTNVAGGGTNNPRDHMVTILGVVGGGVEQFFDGSGSKAHSAPDGGAEINGKWDPGEWFVDVGEPFVDENDNGVYDPNEAHLDVDQYDCAGNKLPSNQTYDGPNGCWDGNITLWRSTRIAYTSDLVSSPVSGSPLLVFSPGVAYWQSQPTVANGAGAVRTVNFDWYDPWFNRLDRDGASLTALVAANSPFPSYGGISVTPRLTGHSTDDPLGHTFSSTLVDVTTTSGGSLQINGPCVTTGIPAAGERCMLLQTFTAWKTEPSGGSITFTPGPGQAPLPDGGVAPPVQQTFTIQSKNGVQTTPSTFDLHVSFE